MDNSRPSLAGLSKQQTGAHGKYTFAGVMELVDVPDSKSGA